MDAGSSDEVVELWEPDGHMLSIRAVLPEDAAALRRFHAGLSLETTRLRFFTTHTALTDRELARFTNVDHHDREALLALDSDDIVGVARWDRLSGGSSAEVAFVVTDRWQHRGVGTALFQMLIDRARNEGIKELVADSLCENRTMGLVFRESGLPLTTSITHGVVSYRMPLV